MKKLLLAFLILYSLAAEAQTALVSGAIQASASICQPGSTSTANACVFLQTEPNTNSADITVNGTYSGTLQFEVSGDGGVTWVSVNAYPPNSATAITSTTGKGTWTASMAGHSFLRVRCSTYSSGVAIVTLNPSQAVTPSVSSGGGGGSGTVTEVDTGTGLTGGPITTSGSISCAMPSASTIGCVESIVAASHNWIDSISTSGVPHQSQPACGDLSDSGTGCSATIASYAPLASPSFTGTPSGPTPAVGTATTQLINAAFYANSQFLDPTKYAFFFDDFVGWSSGSVSTSTVLSSSSALASVGAIGMAWESTLAGSGTVAGQAPWESGAYGVAILTTGTTSGNATSISNGGNASYVLNAATFDLLLRFKIGSTASTSVLFGFVDNGTESAAGNVIGVAYDTNQSDTSWMAVCKAASTATRTAIAGTLDTAYHDFHVWATVAGTINFTVDGGATTTIATNVPSAALIFNASVLTRTTAAKNIHIDYVRFYENVSR